MQAASTVTEAFRQFWEGFVSRLPSLLVGLAVLAFFCLFSRLVRLIVSRSLARFRISEHSSRVISRFFSLVFLGAGVMVALGVMGINPGALVASLGLVSVGLGFALKDVIENFLAGMTIILQKPFVVGDAVRFGDVEGVVEDVRVRDTVIRMYDGRKVFVPNRSLFSGVLINATVNRRRRLDFRVGIPYEVDPERAMRLAEEALRELEGALEDPPPLVLVDGLGESALELKAYFWVDPVETNILTVRSAAVESVKRRLEEEGINIPYPVITVRSGE